MPADGNMEQGTRNREARRGFKQLDAWAAADDLGSLVFRSVRKFPPQDRWLASQMARSAVSVPANIAEGYGRGGLGDYLRFLDIAKGSLAEIEYYIHFVEKEGLLPAAEIANLILAREKTGKLLHGLWLSLKRKGATNWDHSSGIREVAEERYGVSV
jgi:four helix bundle protein